MNRIRFSYPQDRRLTGGGAAATSEVDLAHSALRFLLSDFQEVRWATVTEVVSAVFGARDRSAEVKRGDFKAIDK